MPIESFTKDGIPTVTPKEVAERTGFTLVDVRAADEFVGELGHIEGAQLITLGPELDQFLASLTNDAETIFICRSGARSGRATSAALALGLKNSYNMEGGMLAWNASGLPTVK